MRPTPIVRNTVVAVALALGALTVAACGSSDPPSPPAGIEFIPAQYSSWDRGYETFCNHGNRIYGKSNNDGGVAVVPADPSCKTTP